MIWKTDLKKKIQIKVQKAKLEKKEKTLNEYETR